MEPWLVVSTVLGGGILVALFTVFFQLGRYSMRVEHLESTCAQLNTLVTQMDTRLESMREDFGALKQMLHNPMSHNRAAS